MQYVSDEMEAFDEIKDIVEEVLDEPKRSFAGSGGWYEYNCPSCAEENCGNPDGKYNLAMNFEHGCMCHCWRCGWSGKISKLLKTYGTMDMLDRYKACLSDIMNSRYYEIENGDIKIEDTSALNEELKLPELAKSMYDGTEDGNSALDYMHGRGVGDEIIDRFGILYVPRVLGFYDNPYRGKIIIPSYNQYGELNYFTGRDYVNHAFADGKKFNLTKMNPNIPKKDFVFNEGRVNWYEPVTLVEGPFDHIVTPNSIPILGSVLSDDCEVYKRVVEQCREKVNIMLDDDAYEKACRIYRLLENTRLHGNVRIIKCPNGYDPSDYYRDYGYKGMLRLMSTAHKIDEYTLLMDE